MVVADVINVYTMDYILSEYGDNLLKYFNLLSKTGGTHAVEPYRFLVVGYIDEVLNSGMSAFITEEDYMAIDRLLNCLMGTCLMPFHEWQNTIAVGPKDLDEGVPIVNEYRTYVLAPESFTTVYRTE